MKPGKKPDLLFVAENNVTFLVLENGGDVLLTENDVALKKE